MVYVAGHARVAAFENNRTGFYTGLFLIGVGSGGIKPLVSTFVGDQFDSSNKYRAKLVYDGLYWVINFGSFFASLLMPLFLCGFGAAVAFGIPGALMAIALWVFWLSRTHYVRVPPAPPNPDSLLRVAHTALLSRGASQSRPGLWVAALGVAAALAAFAAILVFGFVIGACLALGALRAFGGIGTSIQLERARAGHPDEAVDGLRGATPQDRVRASDAVLVPVRPEGIDSDSARRGDGETRVVPRSANAGTEPVAGTVVDPIRQLGAVSTDAAIRHRTHRTKAHGCRHRVRRVGLDRRGIHPACNLWRRSRCQSPDKYCRMRYRPLARCWSRRPALSLPTVRRLRR